MGSPAEGATSVFSEDETSSSVPPRWHWDNVFPRWREHVMLSSFLCHTFPQPGEEAPIGGARLMGAAARQTQCIDLPVAASRWSLPGASLALFVGS